MSKIVIRADGGKDIGLGHVMRTLVLANELRVNNEVIFICRNSLGEPLKYLAGIEKIKSEGFEIILVSERNLIDDIKVVQETLNADVLITDSYDVDEEYFVELKRKFKFTGYIDDVNICKLDVDFIINQNINATNLEYEFKSIETTKLFLGPQYCLLREEFRNNNNYNIKDKVEDILITVGGMDNDSNTIKIIKEIQHLDCNIHVVIGSAFDDTIIKKIEIIEKEDKKIKSYKNANMALLMKQADIAISATGSTVYELAAMKVPTVGIIVAENQIEICNEMNKKGLIIGVGKLYDNNNEILKKSIESLIKSKFERTEIMKKQSNLVNVNGAKKLAYEIDKIIN